MHIMQFYVCCFLPPLTGTPTTVFAQCMLVYNQTNILYTIQAHIYSEESGTCQEDSLMQKFTLPSNNIINSE